MPAEPKFFGAMVDPDRGFVNFLVGRAQERIGDNSDWLVLGYADQQQLVEHIDGLEPFEVPLLVIADHAARTPTVQEGVFARAKQLVPRCQTVFYSGSMEGRDEMERLLLVDYCVPRSSDYGEKLLLDIMEREFRRFAEGVEYALIMQLWQCLKKTPHPDESTIGGDAGKEYSPLQMFIEMARGTEKGRRYLRNLSPNLNT